MAGARCGWWSTSSVAAMSRSGRSVSATTSNAVRLTLKRASSWLTCAGSSTRVSAVRSVPRERRSTGGCRGEAAAAPPRTAGDHRCGRPTTRPHRPARPPPRCRDDLEVRGQLNQLGVVERLPIRLRDKAVRGRKPAHHRRRGRAQAAGMRDGVAAPHHQPGARTPTACRPRSRARTTRWSASTGSWPAPSPSTVTTKPEEVVSTVISSHRLNARPMLSKPGPRFALEAETTAVATSPAGSIGVTNVTAECGRYVRGLPGIRP